MRDPQSCADGHSYEKEAIITWLQSHATSPVTNKRLTRKTLFPNHALRNSIEEWLALTFKQVARGDIIMGRRIGTGSAKSAFEGTYKGNKVAVLQVSSCQTYNPHHLWNCVPLT